MAIGLLASDWTMRFSLDLLAHIILWKLCFAAKKLVCIAAVLLCYVSAVHGDMMNTSGYSSPIRTYMDNYHKMRVSHDEDRSDPKVLCSLGVVDLDLSLSPDAFGLRDFDSKKPLTRMLPGSNLCELRLMLPD